MIEDISYFTTGCGFGTATCSLVVDLAKGKTIDEAAAIASGRGRGATRRLSREEKRLPERALEALHVAIDDYRAKVAAGTIPDYAAMPPREAAVAPPSVKSAPVAASLNGDAGDGKLLIKLR